jgi:hypothetical protein
VIVKRQGQIFKVLPPAVAFLHSFYNPFTASFLHKFTLKTVKIPTIQRIWRKMFKKLSIPLIVVLLATSMVAGAASAKSSGFGKSGTDMENHQRMLIGQVIEIGASEFTVEGLNGDLHIIKITEETDFRTRGEEESSEAAFSNLEIGKYVGVINREDSYGTFSARLVVLLPDDFNPSHFRLTKAVGEVSMVTTGGGFFKLETRSGEKLTINVDENTRYAGGVESLEDLEKGDKVGIVAQKQEDGTLMAKAVVAPRNERRVYSQTNGTLTGISGNELTITDRQDQVHTFTVTEDTLYKDRSGEVDGIEDLETGMIVVIVHLKEPEVNVAKAVIVADEAILSLKRTRGLIKSINKNQLTLDANGQVMHFEIDGNIHIKGWNISSLEDLEKDMRVLVLYQEDESGKLIAKSITGAKRQNKGQ